MPNSRLMHDRFGRLFVGIFFATLFFGCKSDHGNPASFSLANIPAPTALPADCPIYGAQPMELVEKGCIFHSDKPYQGPSKSILRIALGSDSQTFHRLDRSEIVTQGILAVELLNNTEMPQSLGWNGDFCRGSAVEIIGVNTLGNHPPKIPGALHVMLPREVIRRRIDFRKNPFGTEALWPLKDGCYDAVFSFWGHPLKETVRICYTGAGTVAKSQNLHAENTCEALNKLADSVPDRPLSHLANRPWPFAFPPNQLPDVNSLTPDRITPLMWASAQGNKALVNWLLDNGALPDGDAIVAASLGDKKEIIAILLKRGARLDTSSLRRVAKMKGSAMIEFLIENAQLENDNYRLVWAVRFANPSYVRKLLESGADANFLRSQIDNYPLVEAIRRGRLEIISSLLEHHAVAELQDLVEASFQGTDTVRLIVEHGVDPNSKFSMSHEFPVFISSVGDTPMTAIVGENTITPIKALLENGANLTTKGRNQMTPLVAAADACAYFSSKYIIAEQGDVPKEERQAAIIAAENSGCPLLAAFLRSM